MVIYMKTVITVKADKEIKEKAQKTAREMGLSFSTVINGLLGEFIERKEIRFSAPYQMTPKLERRLGKIEKDLKTGKNISRPLSTPKEIEDYFNSL